MAFGQGFSLEDPQQQYIAPQPQMLYTQTPEQQKALGTNRIQDGPYGLQQSAYLPPGASGDLYDNFKTPYELSAQLGGGNIRDSDIAALRQGTTNMQNPYYAPLAGLGIKDPSSYLSGFQNYVGKGAQAPGLQDAQRYFQQQSMQGPQNGVNYFFDNSYGVRGNVGNFNFDVNQTPEGANGDWLNSIGKYFRGPNDYSGDLSNYLNYQTAANQGTPNFSSVGSLPYSPNRGTNYYGPSFQG